MSEPAIPNTLHNKYCDNYLPGMAQSVVYPIVYPRVQSLIGV